MKPAPFSYIRVATVEEAANALSEYTDAKLLAGGQSLIPLMNYRLSKPTVLIDLCGIEAFASVSLKDDVFTIRAGITHQSLHEHPLVRAYAPVLAECAGEVGHWAIRNRGTLGGSLAHADPASELPAAMVALDARFVLTSVRGERTVTARDFYLGLFTTDLAEDEILTRIHFFASSANRIHFAEIARRPGDFALSGAFVRVEESATEITWFGVSDMPYHLTLDALPVEEKARQALFTSLASTLEPLDQTVYRRKLAAVVAERAYLKGRRVQA
ncbi:FAD binding domain-containing protein [Ferroacidibacillus organovorans]|uniref:FAD-binding PCMH-type domain-containing protein n=1 Tax=Ferroacidibacillus organovorans TaxID=1765683 RepID=A0A162T668_9BACL|nr:FAD binding domain-containing protein [Ferroacidibacillus organovorans]KYP80503.1 hypothetical protein AYJ22_02350 [Ferroacidibacillus organovorans]OAG94731.1 hypothetical protein AYW79_04115 [Ferroacidibacillus organovorans]OPG16555.1 hypothetical protein B2M26_06710 [Ferroacidibacillus organovorans]